MKKNTKGKYDHFIEGCIILGVGTVLMLILTGVFGSVGGMITDVFVGVFGYAIYAFVVAFILIGVLRFVNVGTGKIKPMKVLGVFGFATMIICLLHIISSAQYLGDGYGDYVTKCYVENNTAGGVLAAIFTYPLMIINYYFAIITVSLLAIASSGVIIFYGREDGAVSSKPKTTVNREDEDIDYIDETRYTLADGGLNISKMETGQDNKSGKKNNKTVPELPGYFSLEELAEQRAREEYERDNNIQPDPIIEPTLSKTKGSKKKDAPVVKEVEKTEEKFHDAVDLLYGMTLRDQAIIKVSDSPEENAVLVSYTNDYRMNKLRKNLGRSNNYDDGLVRNDTDGQEDFDIVLDDVTKSFRSDSADSDLIVSDSTSNERNGISSYVPSRNSSSVEPDYFKVDEIVITKNIPPVADTGISSELAKRLAKHKAKRDKFNPITAPPTTYEQSGDFTDILRKQREERESKSRQELVDRHNIGDEGSSDNIRRRRERSDKGLTHQTGSGNNISGSMSDSSAPFERNVNIRAVEAEKIVVAKKRTRRSAYKFPPLSLLNDYKSNEDGNEDFTLKREVLEEMFSNFGIEAKVVNTIVGPTFTRMELMMPRGISVNKIANLSNDIAMCLEVESVRCQIPIPGKNLFGVEVPNKVRGIVGLKQVVRSAEFANPKHSITFALGQDCDGNNFVADLAKMPHLLIAGATGAGKSVCINSLICSMVYKYTPQELRLLLVDPKHVELNMYNGIPHMLIPTTVCDKDKALNLLDWAIEEMELRYSTFAKNRVQNIGDYNKIIGLNTDDKLPHIAIIIDEVGDLMTYVKKELEERIVRLTQKARAAGICLILATQRPSVDVITGIIKANLPSRIAFAVASYVDSKTIIDQAGAEKLLRNGDMLFSESSSPITVRVQGTFISGAEVNAVCDYIRDNNEAYFDEEIEGMIMNEKPSANASGTSFSVSGNTSYEEDDMFVRALFYFVETSTVSITKLQRRFSIGFPRAARIVDIMEEKGYLKINGNKKEIAISSEEFNRLYGDRIIE